MGTPVLEVHFIANRPSLLAVIRNTIGTRCNGFRKEIGAGHETVVDDAQRTAGWIVV
jgi:hypothetical protein